MVSSTSNTVTFPAPSATYTSGGQVFDISYAPQGPNAAPTTLAAASTSSISYDLNTAYPSQFGGGFAGVNGMGYNGTATQPWVVTASACNDGGVPTACHVSFSNTTSCASSCVTAATQIVAAQFDDPVLSWDTGPIAPFAVEGVSTALYPSHLVTKCVDAQHLSHGPTTPILFPMQYVAFALDGGAFINATTPQLDPWGVGQNSLIGDKVNHTYVYCAQFDASTVADGLHEIRACAVPVAGPIACLTSAITGELSSGSSNITSRAHGLTDTYRLGITNSQDPVFKNFNGALVTSSNITITGATWHAGGSSPCGTDNCVTYTFAQPTTVPTIPVGTIVNIAGMVMPNCSVTSVNGTGGIDQFNYGSCASGVSFPVGAQVTTSGNTSSSITDTSTACTYTASTGDVAMTIPSATWSASPYIGTEFTLGAFSGGGASSINGSQNLASSASAGTILHFTVAANLGVPTNCNGSGGGPTIKSSSSNVNSNCGGNTCGSVFAAETGPIVTATDGSTYATTVGMLTGNASGGTIAPNWNGHCVTEGSAASGSITCPIPHQVSGLTPLTLGSIQLQSNEFSVVGGGGDSIPPFVPTATDGFSLTGDGFALVQFLADTGDFQGNHVGCQALPCGIPATTNSTIWLTRVDAGTYEQINASNQRAANFSNDGSMWVFTNTNGAIQETDAYVDTWKPTAVASGCTGTTRSAVDWNATGPTYGGSYCAGIAQALNSLISFGSSSPTETVGNNGSGCTTFTSASNSGLYIGEPITFNGLDKGSIGDGSNGLFQTFNLYWVESNVSNAVTLARTPDASSCIKEPSADLSTVTFNNDLSFANVYFKCNTAFGCSGDNTNPETANIRVTVSPHNFNALGGWINFLVDTGNGSSMHSVSWYTGGVDSWQFGTGRLHSDLDMNWPNNQITVTPIVSIPTIPGAPSGRGSLTITGGSLSGTCPGAACTETLTYTINDTSGGGVYSTAKFQAPTASAPGQGIVVQNQTNTGGAGSTDWNCGSTGTPCVVTASTSTSGGGISSGTVSFINATADGTWASAGSNPVSPVTLNIEVAKGTISGPWNGGQLQCANTSTNQSVDFSHLSPVPVMCLAGLVNAPGAYGSTNAYGIFYGGTKVAFSNCIATNNSGWTYNFTPTIKAITPSNGTTNDVITLSTGSTTASIFSYNQCGTVPWTFASGGFAGGRVNDTWEDSAWNIGPNWALTGVTQLGINTLGNYYITNSVSYDNAFAFDNQGYDWGDEAEYNIGSCHNHGGVGFHVRCIAAFDVIPPGPPLWGYLDASPPHIVHTYATYADYLTGPSAEVTCSSVPCVAGSGLGDGGKTSHFYVLDTYGVGRFTDLSWENFIKCGTTQMLGNTINVWQTTDLLGTNPAVELTTAVSGTCPDGAASTATMGWFPITHADTNFLLVSQPNGSGPGVPGSGNATFVKGIIVSDQSTAGTGIAEGFLTKGPNWFINTAFIYTTSQGNDGSLKAISLQDGAINRLFMNFNIYDANFYADASTDDLNRALAQPNQSYIGDVWEINSQTVPVGTTTPNNGYPYDGTSDNNHAGILDMWGHYWNVTDPNADTNCEPNPSGSGNICGGIQQLGMFPSNAIQANQTNGITIVAGTPNASSLKSCPWYCAATDTGGGLY